MYGLRGVTIAAAALAFAAVAVGFAGASPIPTTGAPLTLGQCVATPCISTYPAGEAFFVKHGFTTDGADADLAFLLDPQTRFELTLDGQPVRSALELDVVSEPAAKLYVTNFRFGLTGVHTLVGCWYAEGVLVQCGTRTITFAG